MRQPYWPLYLNIDLRNTIFQGIGDEILRVNPRQSNGLFGRALASVCTSTKKWKAGDTMIDGNVTFGLSVCATPLYLIRYARGFAMQLCDCDSASKVIVIDSDKFCWHLTTTKENKSCTQFVLCTVKPVYNDHLMGYFSAFWSSSWWPRAT